MKRITVDEIVAVFLRHPHWVPVQSEWVALSDEHVGMIECCGTSALYMDAMKAEPDEVSHDTVYDWALFNGGEYDERYLDGFVFGWDSSPDYVPNCYGNNPIWDNPIWDEGFADGRAAWQRMEREIAGRETNVRS